MTVIHKTRELELSDPMQPFWSERYSPATLDNLQSCVREGENIHKEIKLAAIRCAELRHRTEQLQRDIEVGLRAPADRAIEGVTVLCGTIEDLYNETQNMKTKSIASSFAPPSHGIRGIGPPIVPIWSGAMTAFDEAQMAVATQDVEMKRLVKLCKGQAAVVAKRFQNLYDESTKMTKRGGEVRWSLPTMLYLHSYLRSSYSSPWS